MPQSRRDSENSPALKRVSTLGYFLLSLRDQDNDQNAEWSELSSRLAPPKIGHEQPIFSPTFNHTPPSDGPHEFARFETRSSLLREG